MKIGKGYDMLRCFLIFFLFSAGIFSQGKFAYQFTLLFPKADLIGFTYKYSNYILYIDEYAPIEIIDKYVYEVRFSIKLNGSDFTWDKPIALEYHIPGSSTELIILNEDCRVLDSYRMYEFIFLLETNRKGWLNLNIGELDEHSYTIKQNSNFSFLGNSIYIF